MYMEINYKIYYKFWYGCDNYASSGSTDVIHVFTNKCKTMDGYYFVVLDFRNELFYEEMNFG
jgi:hypothetical protein